MSFQIRIYGPPSAHWASESTGPFAREHDEVGKVARIRAGSSMSNTQGYVGEPGEQEKKGVRMLPSKNKVQDKGDLVHKMKMSPLTNQARESG